jgi:hypothetical protein
MDLLITSDPNAIFLCGDTAQVRLAHCPCCTSVNETLILLWHCGWGNLSVSDRLSCIPAPINLHTRLQTIARGIHFRFEDVKTLFWHERQRLLGAPQEEVEMPKLLQLKASQPASQPARMH